MGPEGEEGKEQRSRGAVQQLTGSRLQREGFKGMPSTVCPQLSVCPQLFFSLNCLPHSTNLKGFFTELPEGAQRAAAAAAAATTTTPVPGSFGVLICSHS